MSIDTPPTPLPTDADALIAAAKGLEANEIQALVARMVIDSLGRPWDPLKHPRDAHGRFIETFAEVRALFRTEGGSWGDPRISGRVVAFDHNGDVWVRVDHTAPGYTEHAVGDIIPIHPNDMVASEAIAHIPTPMSAGQRSQVDALAARMERVSPDAAAALRRAADPSNVQPIQQLADLHEARDLLDQNGTSDAVAVRDLVWDISDQLGDHPTNEENLKAAQAMIRDHLAKNPTANAEPLARLDQALDAPAPNRPSAPDAAQVLAGQLHGVADRLQDQNPADAVHVRNVAAALGDVGLSGQNPEARDHALERAAVAAANIKTPNLRKKVLSDIKHMRENSPQENAPAEPLARLAPPPPAASLPPAKVDFGPVLDWARANAKQGGGIKAHENPPEATPEKLLARQAKVQAEIQAIKNKADEHNGGKPIPAQANRLDALVKEHDAIDARVPNLDQPAPAPAAPATPAAPSPGEINRQQAEEIARAAEERAKGVVDSKPEVPNVPVQSGTAEHGRDGVRAVLGRVRADAGGPLWRRGVVPGGEGLPAGHRSDLTDHAASYLTPDPAVRDALGNMGADALDMIELDSSPEAATAFRDAIQAAKDANPANGAAVYVYSPDEYQGMKLYITPDGMAGVAVKPDGDIVSVFSNPANPNKPRGAVATLMQVAVDNGGTHLDAFDPVLPKLYGQHGFVAVARLPFDPAQAPPDWPAALGTPDVVFMRYEPDQARSYRPGDGQQVGSYDEGVALAHPAAEARIPAEPAAPTPAAPAAPEGHVPTSAPGTAPSDTPTPESPDDTTDTDPAEFLAEEAAPPPAPPAAPELPPLGDIGLGIHYQDMPHGLVLRGNTFPHLADIKAAGGFRFLAVPGEQKKNGDPFKAWTATGTPDQRRSAVSGLADRLGLPDPFAADAGGDEYPPTDQQQAVIDAVATGKDVVVRALAGTGKTSTLKMIARRMLKTDPNKHIVYVAFNKSIQEEAQKTMPPNVEARTGDSISFRTMSQGIKDKFGRKDTLRRNADIAAYLGITQPLDTGVAGEPPMSPEEQAMRVMRAIEKFSISADDSLGVQHFDGLAPNVARELLPFANHAWDDLGSDTGRIRVTNSHITKMWALTKPDLSKTTSGLDRPAQVIFFDEAQDINPVMAKVIADQHIQKVYVGDGNQAIYGFRGAEDQLDKVKAPHDLPLTKSWRFGPQIAGMGNRFLALLGSKHRIEGAGPEGKIDAPYTMTDPDAILVRSNAGAIAEILDAQHAGRLVGVPKGTKGDLQRLVSTARWLQGGGNPPGQLHDDLAAFRTWDEFRKAAEAGDDPKVKMLYGIIEDNGIPALEDLVSRLIDSGDKADHRTPDVIVTTAHKAKGLEWDKVKIGGDFRGPRLDKNTGEVIMPSPEEMRLAYVAVTRAMKELDPGSLEWVYAYTDDNGGTVKPETTTPTPEPPRSIPSSPDNWIPSFAEPAPGEASRPAGPEGPPPPNPADAVPSAEAPPTPAPEASAPPEGWVKPEPIAGYDLGDMWSKGDYTVMRNPDGTLRIAEFDANNFPVWRADAASWSDVERQIAQREQFKHDGGLPQDERDKLAAHAEHYGMGADAINAIKTGTPDQIDAALAQDQKYAQMQAAYQDAMGADAWNEKQKQAIRDWTGFEGDVLLKLQGAKMLTGQPTGQLAPQEPTDTGLPEAPPVPEAPQVPAYSGEIREIQPRDLAEILGIPHNVAQWLDWEPEPALIRDPFGMVEPGFLDRLKEDWQGVADAVRNNDFIGAQHALDAVKSAVADDNVRPAFQQDMQAYVDQAQGVLDKVGQRAQGQFEIPGVAQPSAAPRAEHAAPELNAAFDDVLQNDANAASHVKRLASELEGFRQTLEEYGRDEQSAEQVTAAIDALNNRDYQRAFDLLDPVFNQPHGGTPTNDYETGPERYSGYQDFGVVNDAFAYVWDDWTRMLDNNPDLQKYNPNAPQVPASQEPLQSWEKALLDPALDPSQVAKPDVSPDGLSADEQYAQKQEQWFNVVAQLDGELAGTYMGDVYNVVIQDRNIVDPQQIEAVVARLRSKYVADGDKPAVDIIDRVIRENLPGPESSTPGPYDPAANPEAILADAPHDGSPIKDEHRVIDARVRGEIEDVKRGVGLPELPDRLDIDRNGVAVFALDLVDVPAAGNQGPQGGMRRPAGIAQVRRIYTKKGVRYAEVAFYDPAFVDAPNRNAVKRAAGIKNNSPFYVWDGVRIDKIQKVDGENPDAQSFLGHLGPEEARQYAGRNAGRLAQNRGRVRPELERMANLQYIGDRYVPDANGLPVGKGDVVLYNGKKYEVVRVNHDNPGVGNNVRLDLLPVGDDGQIELQAGGKHAEPYARMVQFYDKPLGDNKPAVTVDELKDLVNRLDAGKKYNVGDALRAALDGGDLKEITRAMNEDPAILDYVADGRAYINDYIGRLLNANLRGNFSGIDKHEQEMVRKDKNDLLNAMAAIDGRFLEGTGADRHIRREIPAAGPDQEYKGNQPEVLMPLRYVDLKSAAQQWIDAHPGDSFGPALMQAVVNAGSINLDDPTDYYRAQEMFLGIGRAAGTDPSKQDIGTAVVALVEAMDAWRREQDARRAIRQGGPGAEAQLPGGRTIAPGLVRPPGMPSGPPRRAPVPEPPQDPLDKAYGDQLGADRAVRSRYFAVRNALVDAVAAVRADDPALAEYLDKANNELIKGNYAQAYRALDTLTAVPMDHPNADTLQEWQDKLVGAGHYFSIREALNKARTDWPDGEFPATPTPDVRPLARPGVPAPGAPMGRYDEPAVRQAFFDFAEGQFERGSIPERNIYNGDEGLLRSALEHYRDGGMRALSPDEWQALHEYVGGVNFPDIRYDDGLNKAWPGLAAQPHGNDFLEQLYSALDSAPPTPGAVDNRAEIDRVHPVREMVDFFDHNLAWEKEPEFDAILHVVNDWRDGDRPDPAERQKLRDYLVRAAEANDDPAMRAKMNDWIRYLDGGAAPAAPAAPQKPAVDMPDHMREYLNKKGDAFIRPQAKDAANALNAGMVPNAPDLAMLHEDVQNRVDLYEKRGNNPGKLAEYQEIKDWLDTYAPVPGASPEAPAAPRDPAEIQQAIADAIDKRYAELRADRKNNEARRNALGVQEDGDRVVAGIKQAIEYNDGVGNNNDTRDGGIADAKQAVDDLRTFNPDLAAELDQHIQELRAQFKRDDATRLVDRYLTEAEKIHNADNPNVGERDRMIRGAQDQIDFLRTDAPDLANEMQAKIDAVKEQYAADDIARARAVPVGRTEAVDNLDAMVEAERKRLRDAGDNAGARKLVAEADSVAEKLNDAEEAHKAGDQAGRDAAIADARAAAEDLESINPDLAEAARRAVEGNAARYARADARGAGGADVVPGGADSQEDWDLVNLAAQDFAGMTMEDMHSMRRVGDWEYVTSLSNGINGVHLWKNTKTGQQVLIKADNDYGEYKGNGAAAEEMVARLYRDLGFAQPAAVLINPDEPTGDDNNLRGLVAMSYATDGAWDMTDFDMVGGAFSLSKINPNYQEELFWFVIANGIIGNTDRHGHNLMWAMTPDGKRRLVVIDNGLALMNGSFGAADAAMSNGDPLALSPENVIRGWHGNRNVALPAASEYVNKIGEDAARDSMEKFVRRMQERAKVLQMVDDRAYEYIDKRAQWVLDHLDEYLAIIGY